MRGLRASPVLGQGQKIDFISVSGLKNSKMIGIFRRFRIKHFCRVATRYDKLDARFKAFIFIAAAWIWLA